MLLLLLLSLGAAPAAAPSVTAIPAPVGLEARLIDDAQHGRLDAAKLLDAALVASGVPDAEIPAEARKIRAALAPAIARAKTQRTARQKGDVLLHALHETVLRTYSLDATEIDGVERTGEYNCLSSALLYIVAADGLLDHPRAVVSTDHAFARVDVDGRAVDIETTTPYGFDPDRKKLKEYAQKVAVKGARPEIVEDEHPEELPVASLVAGVYSNRAIGLSEHGDIAATATVLDRGERMASGAFKARMASWRGSLLNDGARSLVDQNHLDDARALLELAIEGTEGIVRAELTHNLATVHLKIADEALDMKDWTGALAHVEAARKLGAKEKDLLPDQSRANAALAALEGSDARCHADGVAPGSPKALVAAECLADLGRSLREKNDVDTALQESRRAYQLDPRPNAEPERGLFYSLVEKSRTESAAGRCDAVEALLREAEPHQAALDGQKWTAARAAGGCWAALGKKAFEKSDWPEAGRLFRRALVHLPDEEALRVNVARVDFNSAVTLAKQGRCDEARALARDSAHVDPTLAQPTTELLEGCAGVRATKAANAKDWAAATVELRRGLADAPASKELSAALGVSMYNLAVTFVNERRCDDARALVPELTAIKRADGVDLVSKRCP